MHNVLFLMTHKGSGHEKLSAVLDQHPNIQVFSTGESYDHPDKVDKLVALPHKRPDAKSVYADVVLNNGDFTCKAMLPWYRFVYMIREPARTLPVLVGEFGDYERAGLYYRFRLRGLAEYALRTPNALCLDWQDVCVGVINPLNKHLNLNPHLGVHAPGVDPLPAADIPQNVLSECLTAYFRYGHLMSKRSAS